MGRRAKSKGGRERRPAGRASTGSRWRALTWADLEEWAGTRTLGRGRSYQRDGQVIELAAAHEDRLVAWVQGTTRYATVVELLPRKKSSASLRSHCSCPVGLDACKHAVAVVVAYLEALRTGESVATAPDDDPRFGLSRNEPPPRPPRRKTDQTKALRAFLTSLQADELVERVLELCRRHPEIAQDLNEQRALATGREVELLEQARRELAAVSAELEWHPGHSGFPPEPDLGSLERRFENLLAHGHADAVVALARELLDEASEWVEQIHEAADLSLSVSTCMDLAGRALLKSSLAPGKRLLFAIDLLIADDYGFCTDLEKLLDRRWPKKAWSDVADELGRRLERLSAPAGKEGRARISGNVYLVRLLIRALDGAGRQEEATELLRKRAATSGDYEFLLQRLIEQRLWDEAMRRAEEGIEKVGAELPGLAKSLRTYLVDLSSRRRDWRTAAAHRAELFFEEPRVDSFRALEQAASKAHLGKEVRAAALAFLETGRRPDAAPAAPGKKGKRKSASPSWPLPSVVRPKVPATVKRSSRAPKAAPFWEVLRDLAIAEKRPDDVLRWHDRLSASRQSSWLGRVDDENLWVADAVAESHPDRALALYRREAERQIDLTHAGGYEAAAGILRKVRDLLRKRGRSGEWTRTIAEIRDRHRRKRRLLEILDALERRNVMAAKPASRRQDRSARKPRSRSRHS